MKTQKHVMQILWIFLLIVPMNLLAQEKEVPITTSSEEALKLFLEGLDKFENIERTDVASFFDKAIQKDPNFALAYLYRAYSGGGREVLRKNLAKAVSLIDKVSEGEKHRILYVQARADGQGVKQKEHLEKLLELFPSDKRVHNFAGGYYGYTRDYSIALKHYKKAAELDNKYAAPYNNMGYMYITLGKYEEADKAFKNYIKLRPDNPNPYDSYAELLMKMGKYDESIDQYKKAYDRGMASSLTGIGYNYIFKSDYPKAREYYQMFYDKTDMLDQKFLVIRLKSSSYVTEGKIDQAVKTLKEYHDLAEKENSNTGIIMSYVYQGFIFTELGDAAEGLKHYEKATKLVNTLELPEGERENFKVNSCMWNCYALTANEKYNEAEAELKNAKNMIEKRKEQGEQRNYHAMAAFLQYKKGNYDKALEHFSKANQNNPWNIYYMADIHLKKDNKEKAKDLLVKLKSWNLNNFAYSLVRNRAIEDLKKTTI